MASLPVTRSGACALPRTAQVPKICLGAPALLRPTQRTTAPAAVPAAAVPAAFNCASAAAAHDDSAQISLPSSRTSLGNRSSSRQHVVAHAVRAGSAADASDALALQHISEITRQVDAALATIVQDNVESALQPRPQHSSVLRTKVVRAIDTLSKGLLERETEVRSSQKDTVAC